MKEFAINQTYYKVLLTISELNKKSYYPLNEGIYKILAGVIDEETSSFVNVLTFGTLTSYSSKKVCHLTLMLFRNKYLEKVYDPKTDELYFKITKLGEDCLEKYLKRKHNSYSKKVVTKKTTIVKI